MSEQSWQDKSLSLSRSLSFSHISEYVDKYKSTEGNKPPSSKEKEIWPFRVFVRGPSALIRIETLFYRDRISDEASEEIGQRKRD